MNVPAWRESQFEGVLGGDGPLTYLDRFCSQPRREFVMTCTFRNTIVAQGSEDGLVVNKQDRTPLSERALEVECHVT
jgi:hypothetical protein